MCLQNRSLGFKPIDKVIVAGSEIAAAIENERKQVENLRQTLVSGQQNYVNSDGTFLNPSDPSAMQNSNSLTGGGFKPVDKAIVAVQWYQRDPQLQRDEIAAMLDIKPDAQQKFLPSGKMAWSVRLYPVICGKRKDWTILMVYDDDHPHKDWGGSVKVYPVKPNFNEMVSMVNRSSVTPKTIPHMLRDNDQQLYMCTQHMDNIRIDNEIFSAAEGLRYAMRWITVFELGLIDQITWSRFQEHGQI